MQDLDELKRRADALGEQLTKKQRAFTENLIRGMNQTQAAEAAGYPPAGAPAMASKLTRNNKIAAYRRALAELNYARAGVSMASLALDLVELKERCMQGKPHLSWDTDQHTWVEDGTWVCDVNGAVKAIKQLADMEGYNRTTVKAEVASAVVNAETMTLEEREQLLQSIADNWHRDD